MMSTRELSGEPGQAPLASGGTWADLLATRQRTLETFAPVFRERDSMRRALSRPIFLPETLRAIAEARKVIAAARAPIAELRSVPPLARG